MPSYSRNSRIAVQVLRLAIAGAVQGGALLAGSVAHAADQPGKFVMTAYTDVVGGASLVSGDFQAALVQTQHSKAPDDVIATNRCVAYTMTGQIAAAKTVCDDAVADAKHDLMHATPPMLWEMSRLQEYLAVAYSNRAVLNWLSHDAAAAERDLAEAGSLAPKAEFVARNISALHSPHENRENALAQATATPDR
jgi:hypothetical protein